MMNPSQGFVMGDELRSRLEAEACRLVLGLSDPHGLPHLACACLLEDLDGLAIRLLAGLHEPPGHEAFPLFREILSELSMDEPHPLDAVMVLARVAARRILNGECSPLEGSETIWALDSKTEFCPRKLHAFIYAASEMPGRPDERLRFENVIREEARALVVPPERDGPRSAARPRIGATGEILSGEDRGSFLVIEVCGRRSYVLRVSGHPDFPDLGDPRRSGKVNWLDWVESEEDLAGYFALRGWRIRWLVGKATP